MSMDDVYSKPGHLIRRAQQIAVALFMEECATFDITPVQYAALVAIREHAAIDATRVSALVAFDRSTIGSVLERLEAKGLIERTNSRQDKRVKTLRTAGSAKLRLKRGKAKVAVAVTLTDGRTLTKSKTYRTC